jgi:adenine-specific DNA-methyltransferase
VTQASGIHPTGRLELTWTNKHLRLLTHEDGSYEWTHPGDHRVAEVRLLNDATTVGEARADRARAKDNLLIRGDALHALTSLNSLPEFAQEYVGKIRLVYIDPPFNTGGAFTQYDDNLEHSVWLTMMRDRLVQIRDLLAPDGAVWLHLDNTEVHRARLVMDEVFGAENYRNTVIWRRTTGKSAAVHNLGTMHDSILVYAKSAATQFRRVLLPYDEKYVKSKYGQSDERGPYRLGDLTAAGIRKGDSGRPWIGINPSDKGLHWRCPNPDGVLDTLPSRATTQEKLDLLLDKGYVRLPKQLGQWPQFKRYLNEEGGVAVGDLWADINVLNSQAKERRRFDTQKPELLLDRIIRIATAPGDVVLDCFAGSGTTAAVAHKLNRRWIAVEWSRRIIETFTMPRLSNVVAGADQGAVTALTEWAGGGGFRVLDVHPSMFAVDDGRVVLADWATGGALAEPVCAQIGYTFEGDAPFCGRRGRQRLAVVNGLVNENVVRLLLSWLPSGELLTVYGTAIDPECRNVLAAERRGSTIKRIPQSVLDDYRRQASRVDALWLTLVAEVSAESTPAGAGS